MNPIEWLIYAAACRLLAGPWSKTAPGTVNACLDITRAAAGA